MRHRVKRVFERDLDGLLDAIDQDGGELLRIIDIPRGPLKSSECLLCVDGKLCGEHESEVFRIQSLNPGYKLEMKREQIVVWMPRYAVVYTEREGRTLPAPRLPPL